MWLVSLLLFGNVLGFGIAAFYARLTGLVWRTEGRLLSSIPAGISLLFTYLTTTITYEMVRQFFIHAPFISLG